MNVPRGDNCQMELENEPTMVVGQNSNAGGGSAADNPSVSVVIPAYNEGETIGSVIEDLMKLPLNLEIIVVNDGSTDSTCEVLSHYPQVEVVNHPVNRGYGQSIIEGVSRATKKIIVTMDSDGQHTPFDIPRLIKPLIEGRCHLIIGSRYHGRYCYQLPFSTRAGEALLEKLLQVIFGITIKNNQSGFRAFRKELVPIFTSVQFRDFALTTELLVLASIAGHKILEAPIRLKHRVSGRSRVKLVRFFFSTVRLFLHYLRQIIRYRQFMGRVNALIEKMHKRA